MAKKQNSIKLAIEYRKQWRRDNPHATFKADMSNTWNTLEMAVGGEIRATPGRMASMFVPMPAKTADSIDSYFKRMKRR